MFLSSATNESNNSSNISHVQANQNNSLSALAEVGTNFDLLECIQQLIQPILTHQAKQEQQLNDLSQKIDLQTEKLNALTQTVSNMRAFLQLQLLSSNSNTQIKENTPQIITSVPMRAQPIRAQPMRVTTTTLEPIRGPLPTAPHPLRVGSPPLTSRPLPIGPPPGGLPSSFGYSQLSASANNRTISNNSSTPANSTSHPLPEGAIRRELMNALKTVYKLHPTFSHFFSCLFKEYEKDHKFLLTLANAIEFINKNQFDNALELFTCHPSPINPAFIFIKINILIIQKKFDQALGLIQTGLAITDNSENNPGNNPLNHANTKTSFYILKSILYDHKRHYSNSNSTDKELNDLALLAINESEKFITTSPFLKNWVQRQKKLLTSSPRKGTSLIPFIDLPKETSTQSTVQSSQTSETNVNTTQITSSSSQDKQNNKTDKLEETSSLDITSAPNEGGLSVPLNESNEKPADPQISQTDHQKRPLTDSTIKQKTHKKQKIEESFSS